MKFNLQKKLGNAATLGYLLILEKDFSKDPVKRKRKQDRNVHRLMKSAYKIPFYRQRFDECQLTPDDFHSSEDLVKFPVLTKAQLREWMKQLHDENPDKRELWDETSTSGSTGIPLKLYQSQKEHACANASWIRTLMSFGYNPFFGKMITYESSYRTEKKSRDSFIQRFGILQRRRISEKRCVGDGMQDVIRELNEYAPDLICLRKNCIVRIALYAQQHDLKLKQPKWYIPVSEMVDEVTRSILEKTFGPGLADCYGCDETGSCLVKRPGNDYYDVCSDTHVVQIYDEQNRLSDSGKVILTALYKHDFPIINYEVGDIADSYTKNGMRYVTKIQGRLNDTVKHENGEETSVLELRKIPNGITGIAQFRYVQTSFHELRVELVRDPKDMTFSDQEITDFFLTRLHELYQDEFQIEVTWLPVIPPDPNGKLRCFVCTI